MKRAEKIIILTFAGLIIALIVYLLIVRYTLDFTTSIIPGWHTTVYPPGSFALLALIVLIPSLVTYLILTGLSKLWRNLSKKLNS